MKFIPVTDISLLTKDNGKHTVANLLNEFRESGYKCVEVIEFTNAKAVYLATSFRLAIKRMNCPHIKVMVRKDKLYLVNTLMD